ncbi:hypothetical protein PHG11b_9 [Flavobacterium phage 11b]|uniref:hypothetical protein n=1 Tax=Flavobacterium phage 11b TaxID=294631 RepID=UPI0000444127|nr:hypothetical protein PHG11b_9 [Flavobacterium phage 11b]CAH56636.1 hypothetical protein PHG11b_9 [Flavobacterium phage 11b]
MEVLKEYLKDNIMEYRSKYIGATDKPFYSIERFRKNKWRFCFAEFDRETANMLIKNPILIEAEIKKHKITGICIFIFMLVFITYIIIKK